MSDSKTLPLAEKVALEAKAPDRTALLEKCRALAEAPSILAILDKELKAHGFAGPTQVPQLVFLSVYTQLFDKPVSLVLKGTSGSGKSFALHAGLRYLPEAAYEEFHGMSEKALLYLEDLNLKHRHLIIQEASGFDKSGSGRVFLRQLMSEGRLNYATVQSTTTGLVGRKLEAVEGPVGVMMTTTANRLHHEDETRFISVHFAESQDRIRDALRKQASGVQTQVKPEDMAPWHALYGFVRSGPRGVKIPFADMLANAMPVSHARVQRDFPQLLSLISAHALMHQCTRTVENGEIIATPDDYSAVHTLVAGSLAEGLEQAVPQHVRRVVQAVHAIVEDRANEGEIPPGCPDYVNQRDIAERLGIAASSVSRSVRQAVEQGFLSNQSPGQGREATLLIADRKLPDNYVLPEPAVLAMAIRQGHSVRADEVVVVAASPSLSDEHEKSEPAWAELDAVFEDRPDGEYHEPQDETEDIITE